MPSEQPHQEQAALVVMANMLEPVAVLGIVKAFVLSGKGLALTSLALTLERLYRLRYLHRGSHAVRTAINLLRVLVLGLSIPVLADSS